MSDDLNCPNCKRDPFHHDNTKCGWRFSPTCMEWIDIEEAMGMNPANLVQGAAIREAI